MRKENFSVGSIVHVYNRGNRKQEIVRDDKDRWYFLQALYYFNNGFSPQNPFQVLKKELGDDFYTKLIWPDSWHERTPIVKILAYVLKDNHFHLLLEELKEGGISKFMKKFGNGLTNRFNTRYKENGQLFQGSYKAKLVDSDNYLTSLSTYIQIKNVLELYPGGIKKALENFDRAYDFACGYKYGSMAIYAKKEDLPILYLGEDNLIIDLIADEKEFKEVSKDQLLNLAFDEKTMILKDLIDV